MDSRLFDGVQIDVGKFRNFWSIFESKLRISQWGERWNSIKSNAFRISYDDFYEKRIQLENFRSRNMSCTLSGALTKKNRVAYIDFRQAQQQ